MEQQKQIITTLNIIDHIDLLPSEDKELLLQAIAASELAYAPYSKFYVGAALRLTDGTIVKGSNQENAAYPLCLCAERVAIAAASNYNMGVTAIAVMARNPRAKLTKPVSPCGACRQVILETERRFQQKIRVILYGETGEVYVLDSANDLLPVSFDEKVL